MRRTLSFNLDRCQNDHPEKEGSTCGTWSWTSQSFNLTCRGRTVDSSSLLAHLTEVAGSRIVEIKAHTKTSPAGQPEDHIRPGRGGTHQDIKEEGRRPTPDAADPGTRLASV